MPRQKTTINFNPVKKIIKDGVKAGLDEYVEAITPVITEATPIKTGALRESEEVENIKYGYGRRFSANTPYAKEQHENMSFHHNTGGPQFILGPITMTTDFMMETIAKAIKDGLNGGA